LYAGYGFITFGSKEAYDTATKGNVGTYLLEGNHINVQPVSDN